MAFNKNKVMDTARKYVEKGQTDKAIKEYLKVVNHDPKDVRVWLKIGDLYAKKGAKPEATETYLKVAKFYGEQGFYLKAVAVYKQILKLDPRMVEVNLKLAELYRQLGLLSDAMQHFERVAAHFHREGKTKEALATIRQLVDLDPDNVATRIKLAELYSKEEMTDEAIQEFRAACDYLRSHNRQDDFIKVAERLLWHDNSDMPLNRELATLYLRRNDARRALQKLQVCFKADPRDVETLALLAQAFQALEQKSKTVSVLKELARVFTENGQKQEALDVHRKILLFAPDDPDSREALGEPPSTRQPAAVPPMNHAVVDQPRHRVPPANPTGSMPLVQPPADAEFEVDSFVDDEESFVADIAVDDESFHASADRVEANADEIVKILTETDVYVKYGLQDKAIEHLRRVFEIDPGNVEARERLKDIYVSMGRDGDAVRELCALAEQLAAQDPDRAETYLAEAAAIEPDNEIVADLAGRLQLDVGNAPDVEVVSGLSPAIELVGNVAPVEDELQFDDIDFATAGGDIDVGYEAPAPQAVEAPEFLEPDGDEFEFELDELSGRDPAAASAAPEERRSVTQEVQLDQLEEELSVEDSDVEELDLDDVVIEGTQELGVDDLVFDGSTPEPAPADDLGFDTADAHYERAAPGFDDPQSLDAAPMDIDELVPTELPDEPRIARPVDGYAEPEEHYSQSGPMPDAPEHLPPDVDLGLESPPREPTHTQTTHGEEGGGTSLEDDLDEADFFVSQGLFDEGRDILQGLLERYPNHPLILAKLQDIAAMEGEAAGDAPVELEPADFVAEPLPDERISNELATKDLGDGSEPPHRPSVKLEHAIDDEDADTHFDLGLAYKEMGLYDEAIKSFTKVVHVRSRAVECNLMIGLCHREQGALAEAVQQFKNGLYVDGITDAEKLGLYYEIGTSYELMSDPGEALYFYEMVLKKDANYRDVGEKVAALQATGSGNGARNKRKPPGGDDLEAAFDNVVDDNTDDISQH